MQKPTPPNWHLILLFCFVTALIVGLGWLLVSKHHPDTAEMLMGLVIVFAVAALIGLLFVVAAGYKNLGLDDGKHPLGLPEGSIRAIIAIMLIMVFIIF